ncbi:hypothetical protein H2248_005158 [Termitomyces sp. 'cryptogamus']|nr:hypothetical protein H2248_005158 [Termitomyces sp. 'cryptogamus']
MTASIGGLGLISLRNPFSELIGTVLGHTDLRTLLCLVVIFIVVFVLAYLTNPSENSLRAYLTEQSFRLHLTRLDDNADDDHKQSTHRATTFAAANTHSFDNSSTFHFANKASISLKTPKHVFHSFGIFTIAAMVPLARSACTSERESSILSDSLYLGAFGRWWRVGIIDAWFRDVITGTKDEESWSSGILSMKNMDRHIEFSSLPFSTKNLPPHLLSRGSPPRLRNREKSSQKPAMVQARSSSPPPLPKSASLPLHTTRLPTSTSDRQSNPPQPIMPVHTCTPSDQVHLGSSLPSRSPSAIFDQSPRIAEVLRQISHSKAAVRDLCTQLSDCQSCAAQSHAVLQRELDSFRERKRQEDAVKLETKSRTKFLDDSRRSTESMKKDAEKKLKAAQLARDNATQRMEYLDKEIDRLRLRLAEDEALVHQEHVSDTEKEIQEALQHKRHEIKLTEDVVAALNQRARELEEKLAEHRQKLASIKERNLVRMTETNQATTRNEPLWTNSEAPAYPSHEHHAPPVTFDMGNSLGRRPSITVDTLAQQHSQTQSAFNSSPMDAYPAYDETLFSLTHQQVSYGHHSTFSPFNDLDGLPTSGMQGVVSPTSQSLIPSALISSIENGGLPRSFQSESDDFMDRGEWRNKAYSQHDSSQSNDSQELDSLTLTPSPVSPRVVKCDPFDVRLMANEGEQNRDQHSYLNFSPENSKNSQRASWLHRASSDPYHQTHEADRDSQAVQKAGPRRWFSSSKEKSRKGLNPDAKVFSLPKSSPPRTLAPSSAFGMPPPSHSFDALNPTGLSSTIPTPSPGCFTRAFAPSPAEREALQRALGGSTNTSFERLPSLSDVGSIPSSPSHVHALPAVIPQHSLAKILPAWLQSLPPHKATNFSPWDDEEPESSSGSGSNIGRQK